MARARDMAPTAGRGLLICSTPRAGTHLLAGLLESTGLSGVPGEYLYNRVVELDGEDIPIGPAHRTQPDQLRKLTRIGTSANGVWGLIVMGSYLDEVVAGLRRYQSANGASWREVIERAFDRPVYVWNRRLDTAAQAVSLYRAMETDVWYADDVRGVGADVPYRRDRIAHWEHMIREQNEEWARRFSDSGITPITVTYEDTLADPEGVVDRVLDSVGVARDDRPVQPLTRRQGNDVNSEWLARYRRDVST
ncbi:Stf0 family sulfotransferase [Streptomyces acidiscabies]|uniref:Stf0 family sulfotransferase n=1 Tax=Streptomyces acidiscabies TaxID=42234 RepID=UPI00117E8E80|nr:Stf0 family sulfotransferase [Streptomyces acidiscabies]